MRESGAQRERRNKITARYSIKKNASEVNLHETDDLPIPDYVMRDFGSPEGSYDDLDTTPHVPEESDANEEFAPDCE